MTIKQCSKIIQSHRSNGIDCKGIVMKDTIEIMVLSDALPKSGIIPEKICRKLVTHSDFKTIKLFESGLSFIYSLNK